MADAVATPGAPEWRSFPPFYAHLDLQLRALAGGECVIDLPYAAHFGNSRGEVHGGIVASVLDIALSQAVRSALSEAADVATISMTVSYLAPAKGVLRCSGKVIRSGRSIAFTEGEAVDEQGVAVCRVVGTYRILRARPRTG